MARRPRRHRGAQHGPQVASHYLRRPCRSSRVSAAVREVDVIVSILRQRFRIPHLWHVDAFLSRGLRHPPHSAARSRSSHKRAFDASLSTTSRFGSFGDSSNLDSAPTPVSSAAVLQTLASASPSSATTSRHRRCLVRLHGPPTVAPRRRHARSTCADLLVARALDLISAARWYLCDIPPIAGIP